MRGEVQHQIEQRIKSGTYETLKGSTVASAAEVSQGPNGRPQANDVVYTGELYRGLDVPAGEAEFVPAEGWSVDAGSNEDIAYQVVRRPGGKCKQALEGDK